MTPPLTAHLRALWDLHKALRPRDYPHPVRTQVVRTRGAVDIAIAETTDLHRALTNPGPLDLDAALDTNGDTP